MYKVIKDKIRGVKVGDEEKTFVEGDILPEDYKPPQEYINVLVKQVKKREASK